MQIKVHINQSQTKEELPVLPLDPVPKVTTCTSTEQTYLTHSALFVLFELDVNWLLIIWDLMFSMCY